jgi:hypothetical protein
MQNGSCPAVSLQCRELGGVRREPVYGATIKDALAALWEAAKSGAKRTPITVEGGHSHCDCGQQVMAA